MTDNPDVSTAAPFARPLYVMAKPVGAACNLACDYCYYLEKAHLFRGRAERREMADDMLDDFVRQYLQSQTSPYALFTWHGGEPLLRPLSFYRRAVELQRFYGRGMHIDNALQTNGTLLTDEWCRFLADNNWLVGVSIDGPRPVHDRFRVYRGGRPSFDKVMRGVEMLNRNGVEWNAMAVVNAFNAGQPEEFYRFFKQIGCRFLQFSPIVERLMPRPDGRHLASPADAGAPLADFSVTPGQWGSFLCGVFDQWIETDVGEVFVQIFDSTLANWVGEQPGVCSLAPTCGHAGVVEHNGDVYVCDHYVFPEYRLGNIRTHTLTEMMYGPVATRFGADKRNALPGQCRRCRFLFACNGECPKNRFAKTRDGEPGLNYLCRGYYEFFAHVAPAMDFMRRELMAGLPPAGVMRWWRQERRSKPGGV